MAIVVLVTAKDKRQAKKIAEALVLKKLVACANIVPGIQSIFRWEGKIDKANEILLIVKSQKSKLPQIIKTVQSLHSYEVPEVIALPVVGGNKKYLDWVKDCVK